MNLPPDPDRDRGKRDSPARQRHLALLALMLGLVVFAIGGWHLGSWLLGDMALRGATAITMKTNAAAGISLLGLSLAAVALQPVGRLRRMVAGTCAAIALAIGVLTFCEHLLRVDLGIDQLLTAEPPGALGVVNPNRMGLPASISVILSATAFLLLSASRTTRWTLRAQVLGLVVLLVALLGTTGHLYGAEGFYQVVGLTAIAWPTALSFLLLAAGILCARPADGLMAQMVADDPGGAVVRRLLLPCVGVSLLLGWLRLMGERLGWYDAPMGTALLVLAFILIFSAFIYSIARRLSLAASEQRDAQESLRRHARETYFFKYLAERSAHPFYIISPAAGFRFVYVNEACCRHLGRSLDEVLALSVWDFDPLFPPERCAAFWEELRAERAMLFESVHLDSQGNRIPVEISANYFAYEGQELFAGWFHNITARRAARASMDRQNRSIQLLSETATRLLMEPQPESLIKQVFDQLARHLGLEVYLNYLVTPDGQGLRLHASVGLEEVDASGYDSLRMGQGICGRCALTGERVAVADVQSSTAAETELIRSLGLRAYACHPLIASGRMFGTLSFGSRQHDAFSEEDLDLLGAVCNLVAAALERHHLIQDLHRRADDLADARRSAEKAKAAAEEANLAKDRFLAVLSHELRTPLAPVLAGVSLLQKRSGIDERSRETLEMIRRNVEMEARLIDDLLDLTRIARGKIELDKRQVDLRSVLRRAVDVCRPEIESRQLHFEMDLGPEPGYLVEVDAGRIQQVFWNLLKNAVKFTPAGGRVSLRCSADGRGNALTEVQDSGMGIEPEALPRIFDAFAQADRAVTRRFGGLGLGLAISKSLVDLHGGTIEASSAGRNQGATFRVVLPLALAAREPTPEQDSQRPENRGPSGGAAHGLRLLVVEDHEDTAQMMRLMLESEGHHVEHAGDVATAIRTADRNGFDMLISDLGLPDGSGLDLLRELRARGHTWPGIALSGYGQESDVEQSHRAGFSAHVVKPVDPDRLLDTIARLAG